MTDLWAPIPTGAPAAAPMPQQQPQQGQPQMQQAAYRGGGVGKPPLQQGMLQFVIKDGSGAEGHATDQTIMQALAKAGYNPQSMSPDGMTVTMQDVEGAYTVKTEDALKNMGWQVHGAKPMNADYSQVNPKWRAAMTGLADDDMRRAYIEGQYRKSGHPMPQIVGSDRDWFVFNPGTSQWQAITNNPEWDWSDAAEAAVQAPRVIGSSLGVLGGIPGVVAGGTGGDIATRLALAAMDPVYAEVAGNNLGGMARDIGINTLVDAGTAGLAKGGGALLRGAVGRGIMSEGAANAVRNVATAGPVSTAARGLGAGAKAAGTLAKGAGAVLDTDLGRAMMAYMNPLTSTPMMAAEVAQLPGQVIRGSAHLPGVLAEQPWIRKVIGSQRAQGMKDFSELLTRPREVSRNVAEEVAERFGREAPEFTPGAREVLGNTAEEVAARRVGDPAARAAYKQARLYNIPAQQAWDDIGLEAGDEALRGTLGWQRAAERVGGFIDQAERAGRGVERAITGAHGGVAKAAKYGGAGMQKAGQGMQYAGTVGQPIEAYNWGRLGAEELYGQRLRERSRAWRPEANQARMSEEILARNR